MILADEMLAKSKQLVYLMANRDFTGILLGGLPNQAWLLPGLKPHTPLIAETSKVLLHIAPSGKLTIVAPNNEIEQIKDEIATLAAVDYYSYPWYRDERLEIARHWIEGGRIGSDQPTPNTVLIAKDMERLRAVLTEPEQTRYRV